jgi:hypothetical protein
MKKWICRFIGCCRFGQPPQVVIDSDQLKKIADIIHQNTTCTSLEKCEEIAAKIMAALTKGDINE